MDKKLTKAQKHIIDAMRADWTLWMFGDHGYELTGEPGDSDIYPQDRTVDILLEKGLLRWKPYNNDTQRECGIRGLELI